MGGNEESGEGEEDGGAVSRQSSATHTHLSINLDSLWRMAHDALKQ